jgi:hypothetical protein
VTGYSDRELPVDLDVVERKTLQQGEVTVIGSGANRRCGRDFCYRRDT